MMPRMPILGLRGCWSDINIPFQTAVAGFPPRPTLRGPGWRVTGGRPTAIARAVSGQVVRGPGRAVPRWCGPAHRSPLAVLLFIAPVQRIHLILGERGELAVDACQVHGPGHVLAHHGGLDRVTGGGADREHAVAA